MHRPTILSLLVALAILAAFFRLIAATRHFDLPARPARDHIYWFFTPLVTRSVSFGVLAIVFFFVSGKVQRSSAAPGLVLSRWRCRSSSAVAHRPHRLRDASPLPPAAVVAVSRRCNHSSEMLDCSRRPACIP